LGKETQSSKQEESVSVSLASAKIEIRRVLGRFVLEPNGFLDLGVLEEYRLVFLVTVGVV